MKREQLLKLIITLKLYYLEIHLVWWQLTQSNTYNTPNAFRKYYILKQMFQCSFFHNVMKSGLPAGRYTTQTGTWGPHMADTCPESHSSAESPACSHAQTMCTRIKEIYIQYINITDIILSEFVNCL